MASNLPFFTQMFRWAYFFFAVFFAGAFLAAFFTAFFAVFVAITLSPPFVFLPYHLRRFKVLIVHHSVCYIYTYRQKTAKTFAKFFKYLYNDGTYNLHIGFLNSMNGAE